MQTVTPNHLSKTKLIPFALHKNEYASGKLLATVLLQKKDGISAIGDIKVFEQDGILKIFVRDKVSGQEFIIGSEQSKLSSEVIFLAGSINLCLVNDDGVTLEAKKLSFN